MKKYQISTARRISVSALWLFALPFLALAFWGSNSHAATCPKLLQHQFSSLQTGQYSGLEAIYRQYNNQGLVVPDFPSKSFGNQKPGNNNQIANFCRLTFNAEFPMFAKSSASGNNSNVLFAELKRQTGQHPSWNFNKHLIDHHGKRVQSLASAAEPDDKRLLDSIHKLLDARKTVVRKT